MTETRTETSPGTHDDRRIVRKRIEVTGVVQWVGFRPFVYQLTQKLRLGGLVFNSSAGVTIEVEGVAPDVDTFIGRLQRDLPPLAEIAQLSLYDIATVGGAGFSKLESREAAGAFSLVPPDAGTCGACRLDVSDASDRRSAYPFTNCTHCGPRYTIIRDIPYDREATIVSAFVMCDACRAEYEGPRDRRFHAQPNACAICGPGLPSKQPRNAESIGAMALWSRMERRWLSIFDR